LSEDGPEIITSRRSPAIFPATSILAAATTSERVLEAHSERKCKHNNLKGTS
jgi:hypothetical protein